MNIDASHTNTTCVAGMYVFVQSTATSRNLNARLISPKHRSDSAQCIEFYYFMYGRNVGILNVYLVVSTAATSAS